MGNCHRKMGNSNSKKKPISSSSQSTTKFDLNKLRSELECCICLSLFEEPKQLQCGHVYCAACVQSLIDALEKRKDLSIICPKCRKQSKVPTNGQFPTAFEVKNLVSFIKEAEAGGCHENFQALSSLQQPDPFTVAKAERLRLRGNEAYKRNALEEAIQLYHRSNRECLSQECLVNLAGTTLELCKFSLSYVDANEALRLNPNNLVEKARRELALDWMGMARETQKKQERVNCANTAEEASNPSWPTKLRISTLSLTSADYVEDNNPIVVCTEAGGGRLGIPLCQLEQFLNEHVDGPVSRFVFKFVKFDEPLVQMLRRIKRERFQRVDRDGVVQMNIDWENCDFSRISETSFHFLLDILFRPEIFTIAEWIGMPDGYDYNTIFTLSAFRNAWNVDYKIGQKIGPTSPNFNLHLDSDVLIDFLHSPGRRRLDLVDDHLHDGFDSFFDRLIHRFDQDTQSRCSYVLVVLLLNVTNEMKERLNLGQLQVLKHPKINNNKLEYKLKNPTGGRSFMFEFHAKRY